MEQLEKTSTPAYKRCPHCKEWKPRDEFSKNRTQRDGLTGRCKPCEFERVKTYRQTPKGRELHNRWNREYRQTPKGIMGKFKHCAKYYLTEKYRLCQERFHASHGGLAAYEMERYHRIQDEAGYHGQAPGNFYPAYRLLKALQNAEVVNI